MYSALLHFRKVSVPHRLNYLHHHLTYLMHFQESLAHCSAHWLKHSGWKQGCLTDLQVPDLSLRVPALQMLPALPRWPPGLPVLLHFLPNWMHLPHHSPQRKLHLPHHPHCCLLNLPYLKPNRLRMLLRTPVLPYQPLPVSLHLPPAAP